MSDDIYKEWEQSLGKKAAVADPPKSDPYAEWENSLGSAAPASSAAYGSQDMGREVHFGTQDMEPKKALPPKMGKKAASLKGVKYVWGGESPKGTDCSGLSCQVYEEVGIKVPRTAATQYKAFQKVPSKNLMEGDSVFFYGSRRTGEKQPNGKYITHVGVYDGKGGVIHASSSKGKVITTPLSQFGKGLIAGYGRPNELHAKYVSAATTPAGVAAPPNVKKAFGIPDQRIETGAPAAQAGVNVGSAAGPKSAGGKAAVAGAMIGSDIRPLTAGERVMGFLGDMVESKVDETRGIAGAGASIVSQGVKKKWPEGFIRNKERLARLLGGGDAYQEKRMRAVLENLDPAGVPEFIAALASSKDAPAQIVKEMKGLAQRAFVDGDADALAEIDGMITAGVFGAAAGFQWNAITRRLPKSVARSVAKSFNPGETIVGDIARSEFGLPDEAAIVGGRRVAQPSRPAIRTNEPGIAETVGKTRATKTAPTNEVERMVYVGEATQEAADMLAAAKQKFGVSSVDEVNTNYINSIYDAVAAKYGISADEFANKATNRVRSLETNNAADLLEEAAARGKGSLDEALRAANELAAQKRTAEYDDLFKQLTDQGYTPEQAAAALEAEGIRKGATPKPTNEPGVAELAGKGRVVKDAPESPYSKEVPKESPFRVDPYHPPVEPKGEIPRMASEITNMLASHEDDVTHAGFDFMRTVENYQFGVPVGMLSDMDRLFLSQNGKHVRDAYEPLRAMLREKHGDTVLLWRAEDVVPGTPNKPLSAYTPNKKVAEQFMGEGRVLVSREVPIDAIWAGIRSPNRPLEYLVENDALKTKSTPEAVPTPLPVEMTVASFVDDYVAGKAKTPEHEQFYANNAAAIEQEFSARRPAAQPEADVAPPRANEKPVAPTKPAPEPDADMTPEGPFGNQAQVASVLPSARKDPKGGAVGSWWRRDDPRLNPNDPNFDPQYLVASYKYKIGEAPDPFADEGDIYNELMSRTDNKAENAKTRDQMQADLEYYKSLADGLSEVKKQPRRLSDAEKEAADKLREINAKRKAKGQKPIRRTGWTPSYEGRNVIIMRRKGRWFKDKRKETVSFDMSGLPADVQRDLLDFALTEANGEHFYVDEFEWDQYVKGHRDRPRAITESEWILQDMDYEDAITTIRDDGGSPELRIPVRFARDLYKIAKNEVKRLQAELDAPLPDVDRRAVADELGHMSVKHADMDALRETLGLDARHYTDASVEGYMEAAKDVDAYKVAARVLAKPGEEVATAAEQVAMGVELNKVRVKLEAARKAKDAKAYDSLMEDAERLADALDLAGTALSRSFNARKILLADTFDQWGLERWWEKKTGRLTDDDKEFIESLVKDNVKLEDALLKKEEQLAALKAKRAVETRAETKGQSSSRRSPEDRAKQKEALKKIIVEEAQRLASLPASMILGAGGGGGGTVNLSRLGRALRDYADILIEEGVTKFEDVIGNIQKAFPNLERKAIMQALAGDDQPRKTKSQLEKDVARAKKQIRKEARSNVDDATEGVKADKAAANVQAKRARDRAVRADLAEATARKAELAKLREDIKNRSVGAAEGAKKAKRLEERIARLEKRAEALRRGERPVRAKRDSVGNDATARLEAEIAELQRIQKLEQDIADAKAGKTPGKRPEREKSERVKELEAELNDLRHERILQGKVEKALSGVRSPRNPAKSTNAEIVRLQKQLAKLRKVNALKDDIAEYQRRLDAGDFAVKAKDVDKVEAEVIVLREERDFVKKKYLMARDAANRGIFEKGGHVVSEGGKVAMSGLSSFDMSYPYIQGALAVTMEPQQWAKAARAAYKSWNPVEFERALEVLRNDSRYVDVIATGVDLPGLIGDVDDIFRGSVLENKWNVNIGGKTRNINPSRGGFKGSARSYDGSATTLRYYMTKAFIEMAEGMNGGKPLTPEQLKMIGRDVATFSGRGSSWVADRVRMFRNTGLFAPSWYVSMGEVALHLPLFRAINLASKTKGALGVLKDPLVLLHVRKYGRMWLWIKGGELALVAGLQAWAMRDGKVTDEDWRYEGRPRNTNYGRIVRQRNGETVYIDVMPEQIKQSLRFVYQMIFGKIDKDGKNLGRDYGGTLGRLLEGKAAPLGKIILNSSRSMAETTMAKEEGRAPEYQYGKNTDPRTVEGIKNILLGSMPLSLQSAKDILETKGLTTEEKVGFALLIALSRAPNTYDTKNVNSNRVPKVEKQKKMQKVPRR